MIESDIKNIAATEHHDPHHAAPVSGEHQGGVATHDDAAHEGDEHIHDKEESGSE